MVPSNNLASPSIYETAQQEFDQEIEEEKFKEFNKLLQDPAPIFYSGSNQHPGIQLCSENAFPLHYKSTQHEKYLSFKLILVGF